MKKFLNKIIGKRMLTAMLAAMLILAIMPIGIASAAPAAPAPAATAPAAPVADRTKCPPGWKAVKEDGSSCFKNFNDATKAGAASCPRGYEPKGIEGGILTCNIVPKKAAAVPGDFFEKIQVLGIFQKVLNRMLWPILVMIGGLLDNSLLFGNGMEERLRDIWIPIRNLVNILFVLVLVGVALYNVLGLGEEGSTYSIKSILPKIIVGIIAINFSFLGVKVFLDAVNVLTVSIFSLPTQVGQGLDKIIEEDDGRNEKLCAQLQSLTLDQLKQLGDEKIEEDRIKNIYVTVAAENGITGVTTKQEVETALALPANSAKKETIENEIYRRINGAMCTGGSLNDQGKQFLRRYGSRNAAFALALNMGKITLYQDINFESLGEEKGVEKLFINTIFSMVLYMVYAASFVALFIVLIARLVVMWLCIAISPVLILMLAAPDIKSKLGGFGEIADQFVKNAIAPILIALSLSIGWIMLHALQNLNQFDSQSALRIDPTQGVPIVGLNTIQDFTVALATIAVVWMGVFTAAEGTVAKAATGWLGDKVKQAGTWLGTLPLKHTPIFPIKVPGEKDDTYSGAEVYTAISEGMNRMTQSRKLADKIFGKTTQATVISDSTSGKELVDNLADRMHAVKKLDKSDYHEFEKLRKSGNWSKVLNGVRDSKLRDKLRAMGAAGDMAAFSIAAKAVREDATMKGKIIEASRRASKKSGKPIVAPISENPAAPATETTNIGGAAISAAFKNPDAEANKASMDKGIKEFNTNMETFIRAINSNDVSKMKTDLASLKLNGIDASGAKMPVYLTIDELEERVGTKAFKAILTKVNRADVKKALAAPASPPTEEPPPEPPTPQP